MAHGDKKWIKDYAGRLKRSNDRTWRDKRSDLTRWKWWKKSFKCAECEEVNRPYKEYNKMVKRVWAEAEIEYNKLFPTIDDDSLMLSWDDFQKKYGTRYSYSHRNNWIHDYTGVNYVRAPWDSDMCDECTAKSKAADEFWKYEKRSKKWYKQTSNRTYRAENNRICRKMLIDETAEDNFPRNPKDVAWWLY